MYRSTEPVYGMNLFGRKTPKVSAPKRLTHEDVIRDATNSIKDFKNRLKAHVANCEREKNTMQSHLDKLATLVLYKDDVAESLRIANEGATPTNTEDDKDLKGV
jgi:hypothetical protein